MLVISEHNFNKMEKSINHNADNDGGMPLSAGLSRQIVEATGRFQFVKEVQLFEFSTDDAGGGVYYVIKTERWTFDDANDLIEVLNDFEKRVRG